MHQKLHFTLRTNTVFLVLLTNIIFVLTVGGISSYHEEQKQKAQITAEINSVAKIVAQNIIVKQNLSQKLPAGKDNIIQKYTEQIRSAIPVDFIVVLNQQFIRYSHPDPTQIGKVFSSVPDARQSQTGKIHYSHRQGILGKGYRIFMPIRVHGHQIGIVCVGMTDKSINKAILEAQKTIILGSLLALISSLILAWILAQQIKKALFNMEPDEIATKLTELYAINDSIDEALIAIDNHRFIITANLRAQKIFPHLQIGELFDQKLTKLIFDHPKTNEPLLINAKEFVVSTSQLIYQNKTYGQIALLQDQSNYQQLSEKLAGSEQYIQALRAQSHEFLNKLQAIYGMIELKQYQQVAAFAKQVQSNYQYEFGQLNQQIASPVIVGFLTGKINQAKEQQVILTVTSDSSLPQSIVTDQLNLDLIKVLGNLIDNALAAIKTKGRINLTLNYDHESTSLIIEISDTGSGISPKVKQYLFTQKYSTKGKDHGYGLILVNQIVHNYHGYLEISARQPHGSIFYIELPLKLKE